MSPTIIDFATYKEQYDPMGSKSENVSPELIAELQILIQRLRENNPIR